MLRMEKEKINEFNVILDERESILGDIGNKEYNYKITCLNKDIQNIYNDSKTYLTVPIRFVYSKECLMKEILKIWDVDIDTIKLNLDDSSKKMLNPREEKLEKFRATYQKYNEDNNIDLSIPHLYSIDFDTFANIQITCEKYREDIDFYEFCDFKLAWYPPFYVFESIDTNDENSIVDFMKEIENRLDWDKVAEKFDIEDTRVDKEFKKCGVVISTPANSR